MRTLHLVRLTCLSLVFAVPCLNFSQDITSSPAKATFLHDLDSARGGDHEAKLRVARAYNEGIVVWRNPSEAAWWFQQAVDEGSIEATAWLGGFYLFGGGVPRDVPRATALLQKAVDANNPIGLRFMGAKYEGGIGVPADPAKAVEFYSRAIALHDPESYGRLGRMYRAGLGVPQDMDKAFALFSEGSAFGDNWSQLNLGQMYQSGYRPNSLSVDAATNAKGRSIRTPKPDYDKARELFAASAAHGNRVAQYELGKMYDLGIGTPRDYASAFEFYKQSSMQRYVPAIVALGKVHELGHGTPVNLLHAFVAYSLAVEYSNGRSGLSELERVKTKLSASELQKAGDHLKAFKEASEAAFGRSLK